MSVRERSAANYRLLSYVASETGFGTVEEMLAEGSFNGICPGVCMRCKAIVESLEPDGYCECEECGSEVKSVLLLAGIV
jgi:rRNA maturation endonuclease Nob1